MKALPHLRQIQIHFFSFFFSKECKIQEIFTIKQLKRENKIKKKTRKKINKKILRSLKEIKRMLCIDVKRLVMLLTYQDTFQT